MIDMDKGYLLGNIYIPIVLKNFILEDKCTHITQIQWSCYNTTIYMGVVIICNRCDACQ